MLDPDRNPLDWSGPGYYAGRVNKANRLCKISLPECSRVPKLYECYRGLRL